MGLFGFRELPGAVGARWGAGLEQNDRTDIEKTVLTPGTIGFKLKPNPREKSLITPFFLLFFSGLAQGRCIQGVKLKNTLFVTVANL